MKLIRKLSTRKDKKGRKQSWGEFLCPNSECDKIVERPLSQGKRDKSCGCNKGIGNKNSFKHGSSFSRLYNIWHGILKRCNNPNSHAYSDYGGRGITICPEWLKFIPFRDWSLSNGYQENLTIDRKDNDGNYEPNNCQWISLEKNSQKKRTTKINLEIANEIRDLDATGEYTQKELAEKYNISNNHISNILNNKRWKNE